MFAVIYQGYLKPGKEADYKTAWRVVASYFIERRGALGSCLHQTEDGLWVAYSRWPDKATRDASWPGEDAPSSELPDEVRKAIVTIQGCLDKERDEKLGIVRETCLNIVDDLIFNKKHAVNNTAPASNQGISSKL